MIVKSTKEFTDFVLKQLEFTPSPQKNFTLYKNKSNPQLGYFLHYSRKNYYDFGIADYTIPKDFSVSFDNPSLLIRFGTVYKGTTKFQIENNPVSSFTPSSFFVIEENLKGKQIWKKGQHFYGAEITIYESYFKDIIYPNFPSCINFNSFIKNYTYKYLPLEIVSIIQNLRTLSQENKLNSIYLESKILECIAILINEVTLSSKNSFTNQINYGEVTIGKNRKINLSFSDIIAIQKAHKILEENYFNPPTITALSKLVYINEQKLKAGFSKYYHMSIGEYTTFIRMNIAETLLSTTDLSIEEIARKVGYNHSSNFSKMFKKVHGITPLTFRKNK